MIDFDLVLRQHGAGSPAARELARAFLEKMGESSRFVMGRNEEAIACAGITRIDGLVDDSAPSGTMWNGLPVVGTEALPMGAIVANCSSAIRPVSAHARIEAKSGVRVVAYSDLVREDARLPLAAFVASTRADLLANAGRWRELELRLRDEASRRVLESIVLYRMTGDYGHMSGFSVRFDEQYFDPITRIADSRVFVDCGGYDGDTVRGYVGRVRDYKRVYMFEPSPENVAAARGRLQSMRQIEIIPAAVSDSAGTLAFDPGAGSASRVADSGGIKVDVVTIDEAVDEPVDFIKMDLEGWERHALVGARRHIVSDHPKLAIAVYHRPDDFWSIPEYVLGLRPDYDLYLRHYSEGWSETVMYFIPH
jgi:FkbM family methyltransferase